MVPITIRDKGMVPMLASSTVAARQKPVRQVGLKAKEWFHCGKPKGYGSGAI
jgi:hypothetical protein